MGELLQLAAMHELNGLATAAVDRLVQLTKTPTILVDTIGLLESVGKEDEGGHLKRKMKENWDDFFPTVLQQFKTNKRQRLLSCQTKAN